MKTTKLLLAAAVAALAFVHAASAQIAIYISGAPATRAIWNQGLVDTLVSTSTGSPTIVKYWTGGTSNTGFATANQIVLQGGNISGTSVTIYGSWTGSTAGNQSVAANPPETNTKFQVGFISPAQVTAVGPGGGGGITYSGTVNLQYPHFNLSDTFQNTTPFHGATTVTSPATNYVTLTEPLPHNPAITGFIFVTNNGAPADLTNITTNLARLFFTQAGGTSLAQFTGSNADEGTTVWPVGRDIGSGARYILLAESGIGTANSSELYQYSATTSGSPTAVITSYTPSSSGTINEIAFSSGNGGYSSFTPELAILGDTSTAGPFVTYVTDSDALTAVGAGARELTWNGVGYNAGSKEGANNTAPTSIAEGQYTYWSYLHVFYNSTFIQANHPLSYSFANSLDSKLSTDTATGAILNSDVSVGRLTDGGEVSF